MEFFAVAAISATVSELQSRITLDSLPVWCASIDTARSDNDEHGEIYCVWGSFRVHRQIIRDGLRFALTDCPNALQWTVTTGQPPQPLHIVIHLTINRTEHAPDFIASNRQFVDEWKSGIEQRWHSEPGIR